MLSLGLTLCASVFADPVLLTDVPRTSWDRPSMPICMLHTALAGMGCPMSYEDLMVASGSAFRIVWRPGFFSYPASRVCQQDTIVSGGAAAGAPVERRQFATVEQAYDAIADSLDQGRPVVAWDEGRVEWQVICGYDKAKRTLFRRDLDTGAAPDEKGPDCLKNAPANCGAQGAYEAWFLMYDPTRPAPKLNWPLIIATALRMAQWPDEERLYGTFVCGDCAYYCWATDLRSSTIYTQNPAAGDVTWGLASTLEKSRRHIGNVLQAHTGVHPALAQAALLYQDEALLFGKVQEALGGGRRLPVNDAGKIANQNVKDGKVREACADLIEQALAKDKAARAQLRLALKDLAPDLLPVEDAPAAPQQ